MFTRTRKFLGLRPRRWRRLLLVAAVLFFVGSAVSIEVTSQPKFCNSCHIMGTYYDSWQHSTHKDVACVDCHIAPGAANFVHAKLNGLGQVVDDLLNRTSTKPSASISDFSCTRSGCHVLGELGDTESGEKEGRSYHFDHDKHLDLTHKGIAIHCATCHSHVKGEKHFEVNTNVCVTCHLMSGQPSAASLQASANSGEHSAIIDLAAPSRSADNRSLIAPSNCDACHSPPEKAFAHQGLTIDHSEYLQYGAACISCHRGATAPAPRVDSAQCFTCHDFGIERFTNVEQMHFVHTEGKHKVECFNCHGWIKHGPEAQTMSLEQFDCRGCHSAQHAVQRVAYQNGGSPPGLGVDPHTPSDHTALSPMFMVHVDCTGCHIQPSELRVKPDSGATVARAVPAACDNCHRPGTGEQMVPLWQRTTRELYESVNALMPTEASPWATGNDVAAQRITQATKLLDLVRLDGSWGVHNPRYTQKLIEQARDNVVKAKAIIDGKDVAAEPTETDDRPSAPEGNQP